MIGEKLMAATFRRMLRHPALCLVLGQSVGLLHGQSPPPMTFHAYANLLQIPVLALSPSLEPLPRISPSKFAIRLDAGPVFRPTHVRLEGEDPIALSILLDVGESDAKSMPRIADALAGLSPAFLRPADHVSIYALDCTLRHSVENLPADSTQLRDGVDAALLSWSSRGQRKQATCEKPMHLWDALTVMTHELSSRSGRRVILAFTDGHDRGSAKNWNEVRVLAAGSAVAIFGMTPHDAPPSSEDGFHLVSTLTGGLIRSAHKNKIARDLEAFTDMLRGRYILEFPRTDNAPAGLHSIEVTIENSHAVVLSTGISVPLPDPDILADPTTVPSDPSRAPQLGNRRILKPE